MGSYASQKPSGNRRDGIDYFNARDVPDRIDTMNKQGSMNEFNVLDKEQLLGLHSMKHLQDIDTGKSIRRNGFPVKHRQDIDIDTFWPDEKIRRTDYQNKDLQDKDTCVFDEKIKPTGYSLSVVAKSSGLEIKTTDCEFMPSNEQNGPKCEHKELVPGNEKEPTGDSKELTCRPVIVEHMDKYPTITELQTLSDISFKSIIVNATNNSSCVSSEATQSQIEPSSTLSKKLKSESSTIEDLVREEHSTCISIFESKPENHAHTDLGEVTRRKGYISTNTIESTNKFITPDLHYQQKTANVINFEQRHEEFKICSQERKDINIFNEDFAAKDKNRDIPGTKSFLKQEPDDLGAKESQLKSESITGQKRTSSTSDAAVQTSTEVVQQKEGD